MIDEFPKKDFTKDSEPKGFSSYLFFLKSVLIVDNSNQMIDFKCIFCDVFNNVDWERLRILWSLLKASQVTI